MHVRLDRNQLVNPPDGIKTLTFRFYGKYVVSGVYTQAHADVDERLIQALAQDEAGKQWLRCLHAVRRSEKDYQGIMDKIAGLVEKQDARSLEGGGPRSLDTKITSARQLADTIGKRFQKDQARYQDALRELHRQAHLDLGVITSDAGLEHEPVQRSLERQMEEALQALVDLWRRNQEYLATFQNILRSSLARGAANHQPSPDRATIQNASVMACLSAPPSDNQANGELGSVIRHVDENVAFIPPFLREDRSPFPGNLHVASPW
jgi:hypothetical protein